MDRLEPSIRSRSNQLIRTFRLLCRSPEDRESEGAYVAYGVRLAEEALRHHAPVELALCSPRLSRDPRGRTLHGRLRAQAPRCETVSDELLGWTLGVSRHQGVALRVSRPAAVLDELLDPARHRLHLVAWGVQDPGNLGGLLRIAAAAGASGLLCVEGCADPFNPKAVRASAGALFHKPAMRAGDGRALLARLGTIGYARVGAFARGGTRHDRMDWGRATALVLGAEAGGIPEDALDALDGRVTIPMEPGSESLNVLSAATLLVYEAARQRGFPVD